MLRISSIVQGRNWPKKGEKRVRSLSQYLEGWKILKIVLLLSTITFLLAILSSWTKPRKTDKMKTKNLSACTEYLQNSIPLLLRTTASKFNQIRTLS